jgi:hypothetical protein
MYRGAPTFQKPENALKRAEELISVGQPFAALNALHEVITSKRHRTWQKTLEQIMFKYVECAPRLGLTSPAPPASGFGGGGVRAGSGWKPEARSAAVDMRGGQSRI